MADGVVRAQLIADASKWRQGMREADRATAQTEKQLTGFGKAVDTGKKQLSDYGKFAVAGLAAGAGAALISFFGDATKAAMDDIAAQEQLKLALQNTTGATDEQVKATEDWIKETSLASGVADDELRPALANLARATGDVDEAQRLLGVAMDIAAAKGKPLESVTEAMSKAALGNVGALGRMGIATRDASGEMMTFEEVIADAERTMGDASEVFAETEAGSLARLNVRLEELKETIGAGLLPAMVEGAEAADNLLTATSADINLGWSQKLSAAVQTLLGESAESVDAYIKEKVAINNAEDAKRQYSESITKGKGVLEGYNRMARDGAEAIREQEGATRDASAAIRDNTSALQEAADPALAALRAAQRVTDAQKRYNDAVSDSGPLSSDAQEAALDLATAQAELEGAAKTYAEQGGAQSNEALLIMLGRAGITADTIDAVRRALERLNATPINRTGRDVTGRATDQRTEFHSGGTVAPGLPTGTPVPATLLAGETVMPIGSHAGHGGGTIVYVTINATSLDPAAAGKTIVQALQDYNRKNGGIPIITRQP